MFITLFSRLVITMSRVNLMGHGPDDAPGDAYNTIAYNTIPYHTIPYHTIPYHTIPYPYIPHNTIPAPACTLASCDTSRGRSKTKNLARRHDLMKHNSNLPPGCHVKLSRITNQPGAVRSLDLLQMYKSTSL